MNLLQKWKTLPRWLRFLGQVVLFIGLIRFVDSLGGLLPENSYASMWLMLSIILVMAIAAVVLSLRYQEPESLLAEAVEAESPAGVTRQRRIRVLMVIGGLACIGLTWLAIWLVAPGDRATQAEGVLTITVIMGFVIFGLPVTLLGLGWLIGALVPASWQKLRYQMHVAAEPVAVWSARRDIAQAAQAMMPRVLVDEVVGAAKPTWHVYTKGLVGKLNGMDQMVSVLEEAPGRLLIIESKLKPGGMERTRFEFSLSTDGGTDIEVTGLVENASPLLKCFSRLAGHKHLAKGGAAYETRRFAKLAGADAVARDVESETSAERLEVDF